MVQHYQNAYQHKSVLEQPKKRSASMYKVQLGEIGQKYDEHLRKTVKSQTKTSFKIAKDKNNLVDQSINKAITTLEKERE